MPGRLKKKATKKKTKKKVTKKKTAKKKVTPNKKRGSCDRCKKPRPTYSIHKGFNGPHNRPLWDSIEEVCAICILDEARA